MKISTTPFSGRPRIIVAVFGRKFVLVHIGGRNPREWTRLATGFRFSLGRLGVFQTVADR